MLEKLLWRTVNIHEELRSLRNKVKHLEDVEFDNSTLVENEEIQPGKKRKREVESWFENVQYIRKALEQIETGFKDNGPSNNLKESIKNLTKEVDELIQQGKFPTGVVLDDHASTRLPLVITELVGQSCSENIASILTWLKEDDVFAIGLYGMGGVGKTTLIEHVHNKLLQDSEIQGKVYMVTASQECTLQKLQIDIGKAIGVKYEDLSQSDEGRRKALLLKRFTNLRKSVLIMDDMWKHYLAEEIGIPLKSCKIVLTSRLLDVCQRMDCNKIVKIVPLTQQDSMKLFSSSLGVAVPEELKQVENEIVDQCGGLPLALKTMGCCMRGTNDVHDWQNALCELRAPVIRHEFMEERVFQVLKYSYNNLKDETTKYCFLSCVLFPEDEKIRREDLVRLWINEGLLDETESEKDKVNRGYSILNGLEKLCLLESITNYTDYVKMHDLVRDLAIIITQDRPRFMAKSGTNMEKMPEKEYWSKDLLKVGLSDNRIREIPSDLAPMTMELSVLLLQNNPLKKIPESFFVHMRALTVLDLSFTNIENLPESVSKMENLRALLLLDCAELNHVPALDKLVNLRRLDLTGTSIKRLPESVSKLENLRELLLNLCEDLTYVPSLARLTNLRELDLFGNRELERVPKGMEGLKQLEKLSYSPWNVNDMSGFCRLFNSLTSLCCYRILLTSGVLSDIDVFYQGDDERIVWIIGAEFGEDEIVTELLLDNIEELIIGKSEMKGRRRLGDVFSSSGKGTNLTRLDIIECRGFEYIISGTTSMWSPFDTLQRFYLVELPDLKRIVEYGGCYFSKLEYLYINNCPKIKEVFPFLFTSHEISLPNLCIEVKDCEEVEQIFPSNNATPLIPNPVFVLNSLTLINLPKLESIYKGVLFLTSFEFIKNCPRLNVLEGEKILKNVSDVYDSYSYEKVICDSSSTTLASIKSENAKEWWDDLQQKYPKAAASLFSLINPKQDENNIIGSSK